MVISNEEFEQAKLAAKRDPKLTSLFQLRNTTKYYLIQCLADREIQKVVWNRSNLNKLAVEHLKSKVYQYNCRIIHSPQNYAKVHTWKIYFPAIKSINSVFHLIEF